jgi:hypothetical protein
MGAVDDVPVLDYIHYGLNESWSGLRWLDLVVGDGVALWLGHAMPELRQGLIVGTFPRRRFDEWSLRLLGFTDGVTAVASLACEQLIRITMPDRNAPQIPGVGRATIDYVNKKAALNREWGVVSWRVDELDVAASVWQFAGAWVGITEGLPGYYLAMVGVGFDPSNVHMGSVNDADYGFSVEHVPVVGVRGRRTSGMAMPRPNQDRWHPDQIALVGR